MRVKLIAACLAAGFALPAVADDLSAVLAEMKRLAARVEALEQQNKDLEKALSSERLSEKDPELVARVAATHVGVTGVHAGPRQVADAGIKPLRSDWRICGPAFTVRPEHTDDLLMGELAGKYARPGDVIADRGYDARAVLDLIRAHGGRGHIPTQRDRKVQRSVDPALYRKRNLIERFFNKLKHFRKVATRYEKSAQNYMAVVLIASSRLWMRHYESTS